ncbi:formylglycine-generating enzyme family protein [Haliscomenobacter sp.]|uniref:formylglycine-generating enzyme family protein n=1 Tax=Haliscomenobacter sp. TaxID=2717303 RepID=UPI0035948B3F
MQTSMSIKLKNTTATHLGSMAIILMIALFCTNANKVQAQGKIPASAQLILQSGIQDGANGRNRIPLNRTDPAYTVDFLDIAPSIRLDVTFTDGTNSNPNDFLKSSAQNLVFDDVSGDPNDIIQVSYWNVDDKNPGRGKYAAQLTSTGKGVGRAYLKVSFRNAPGVSAWAPVEVVSGTAQNQPMAAGKQMSFVYLPEGNFLMGSRNPTHGEMPERRVKLSKGFWMQTTEVTQGQWQSVMGSLPTCEYGTLFPGGNKPVACVSWEDTQLFIAKLNAKNDGFKYRLPTAAEWEYAARAGTWSENLSYANEVAWYADNAGGTTHDVGTKQANPSGLYDMNGNVLEWVNDLFGDDYYGNYASVDPKGDSKGEARIYRGSCFNDKTEWVTPINFDAKLPTMRDGAVGFRLVRTPK